MKVFPNMRLVQTRAKDTTPVASQPNCVNIFFFGCKIQHQNFAIPHLDLKHYQRVDSLLKSSYRRAKKNKNFLVTETPTKRQTYNTTGEKGRNMQPKKPTSLKLKTSAHAEITDG